MMPNSLFSSSLLAAATPTKVPVDSGGLVFGWFDGVVLVMLIIGVFRGRKRGMTGECLDLIQWLVIVFGGGRLNQSLGQFFARVSDISPPMASLAVYVVFALVVKSIFVFFKGSIGKALLGSEMFGGMEYYLGMLAGAMRYGCMVLALLAILDAWDVSQAEVEAKMKVQEKELGKVYFPPLIKLHYDIMKQSLTGTTVRNNLPNLLISSSRFVAPHRETSVQQHAQDNDDVLGIKRTNVVKPRTK